jgi:ribosomal protein S18 acetylase RimI-like enzyme
MAVAHSAADVEALARATIAAVTPEAVEELDGWLLAFDSGVVGRAKCAVPLRFEGIDPKSVAAIEARYAARAQPPLFRVAEVAGLEPVRAMLEARAFRATRPTLVQIAPTAAVRRVGSAAGVQVAPRPDAAWIAAFLGEGFDPVEGESRSRTLARGTGTLFASVRDGDVAIGAGALSIGFGWASVHGMRTAKARRGEGIAARILSAFAAIAAERGLPRMFLQVEAHNPAALSLYRRAGFATAWRYAYWEA